MSKRYSGACDRCGGSSARGWSDGQPHARCAACEAVQLFGPLRPLPNGTGRPIVVCGCGCGRVGPHHARGYVDVCYRRWLASRRTMLRFNGGAHND